MEESGRASPPPAGLRVVDRFRTRKAAALLAYLACHPGGAHPREVLIELLWPGAALKSGQTNLRRELTFLRRQLEPPGIPAGAVLLADRSSVQLRPAAVETDVVQFEALLRAARRQPGGEDGERVGLLIQAVDRYRGELLPGFSDEWVLLGRQRWRELYLHALEELVAALEVQGELRRAIEWARRGVNADPVREELQHPLIRLLAAAGDPEAATRQYQELAAALQRETGLPPGASLAALLRSAPSAPRTVAARPASPPAEPESADAGPNGARTGLPGHLPRQFTGFFGREAEIERLGALLLRGPFPLVTLTGPGGMGKTRLAVAAAESVREQFPGGAWFVPLAELTDPAQIPDQILAALQQVKLEMAGP